MAEAGKTEEKVFVKKYRKPAKKKVCAFCVAGEKTIDQTNTNILWGFFVPITQQKKALKLPRETCG